jgi:hypothetical protein
MAFKMKGFPLRSGFAHADTKHGDGDHQHIEQKEEGNKTTTIVDNRSDQQKIDRLNQELASLMKWWNSDARTQYPAAEPSTKRRINEIKQELAALGG